MNTIESATVYFTSLCNSGCRTCDIWKNPDRIEFPLEEFKRISSLPMMKGTVWTLIGGEFTVYPKYIEVIEHLNAIGGEYYFITNGILPKRVEKVYERTTITNLSFSLDAVGPKHDEIRGAPDNFEKIVRSIIWVQDNHPETKVRIGYTLSNFNTRSDLEDVIQFGKDFGLEVKYSIASQSEILLSHTAKEEIALTAEEVYPFEDLIAGTDNYLRLYRPWARGLSIPCDGISHHVTINYDGRLMLCENLNLSMGNVLETPLEDLWVSAIPKLLRQEYRSCDRCWMSCVRKFDAKQVSEERVLRSLEAYK